jgi:hypothetical protein
LEPHKLSNKQEKIKLTKQWEKLFMRSTSKMGQTKEHERTESKKRYNQSTIINTNGYHENNLPWGDNAETNTQYEGIVFHNVNGLKDIHNWWQILASMKELNVYCIGLAKINTSMKGYRIQKWNEVIRKIFRVSRMAHPKSDIDTDTEYKPGGTITAVVDKWQARTMETGNDERG